MNAIFDSNIFIAIWHRGDSKKDAAIKILDTFKSEGIKNVYITNYVLVEVINFLLKKMNFEDLMQVYDYLTTTDRIKIIQVDKIMETGIHSLFLQYKSLSLTDCSLAALAKELSIRNIYSFDSGFDKVKGIIRLEN